MAQATTKHNDWQDLTLGDLYEFSSGLSKSRDEFGYGYDFVTFKDVFHNYFLPEKLTSLANTSEQERERCSVKRGDVFLTRTSETQDELGMSSVALKDYPQATFNGFTKRLRPKDEDRVSPEFVGYYLRSSRFRSAVTSLSSMTTRASLNNGSLTILPITLPPIEEQRAIAAVLLSLDNKTKELLKQNIVLEKIAQTIYKEWFEKYKVGSKLPEGWQLGKIGDKDFADFVKSGIDHFDGEKVYLATADVSDTEITNRDTKITYNERPSRANMQPRAMTIWFARMQNSRKILMFDDSSDELIDNLILSTGFAGIKTTSLSHYFLWCFVISNRFDALKNLAGSGAVQISANNTNLKEIEFVRPTDEVLSKFSSLVKPFFGKIQDNTSQIQTLTILRDTLLPRLIRGEVRVKNY